MATLVNYKGLQVFSPFPGGAGAGGAAIQEDLESLVAWNPKSVWGSSDLPTTDDNTSLEFWPRSLWSTNDSTPKLFLCTGSVSTTADWSPILMAVEQDTSPSLGGNLNAAGFNISSVGNIGLGVAANSAIGIYLDLTLSASGTVRGLYFTPSFGSGVTNPIAVNGVGNMLGTGTAPAAYTFRADDWDNGDAIIDFLHGFYCGDLTAGGTNYGFRGLVNAGTHKWNLFMDGTAPNLFNGDFFFGDGLDLTVGTSSGTRIGTAANQKLGFWGATAVSQFSTTGTTTGFTGGSGTAVKDDSTFTGGISGNAYTIGDLVAALKTCGIMQT